MYRELTVEKDRDRLLEYWRAEQNAPRWYQESNEVDVCDDVSFLDFCSRHALYEIQDSGLLYLTERKPGIVQIHFSTLKCENFFPDLLDIRSKIFANGMDIIYGCVLKANRPLRSLCTQLGMYWNGLTFEKARENKKPFVFWCYAMHKNDFL